MKQSISSYDSLSRYINDNLNKYDNQVFLILLLEKVKKLLHLKLAALYRPDFIKSVISLYSFQGKLQFVTQNRKEGICGKAWETYSSVFCDGQVAIPIMGQIMMEEIFLAVGDLDEEDMAKLESVLAPLSKEIPEQEFEKYAITQKMLEEKVSEKLCNLKRSDSECSGIKWQDFVLTVAAGIMSNRKRNRNEDIIPNSYEETKEMLKGLFHEMVIEKEDQSGCICQTSNASYFIRRPSNRELHWNAGVYTPIIRPLFESNKFLRVEFRTIGQLKMFGEIIPQIKEWFPEINGLVFNKNKMKVSSDLQLMILKQKAIDFLTPIKVKWDMRKSFYRADYYLLNISIDNKRSVELGFIPSKFDQLLSKIPDFLDKVRQDTTKSELRLYGFGCEWKRKYSK